MPLESVEPVFTGTLDQESLFFECGREVLTDLHRTLVNEPISLMLTDADGLVLNRLSGDTSLLRALDAVHLAPGFAYAERAVGTNGLGLALADRVPTVVRAEEHYSLSLCTYTCAAVPVLDPLTGRLEGCVNLTTWSRSSSDLLLALAQSAAGNTAALMLARSQGRRPRPAPRGEVFRVETPRLEPGAGSLPPLSAAWRDALAQTERALAAGRVVAVGRRAGFRPRHAARAGGPAPQPARADPVHERPGAARTSRPGCRCGRRSSASRTPRSWSATWTGCRPGSPSGCGSWSWRPASRARRPADGAAVRGDRPGLRGRPRGARVAGRHRGRRAAAAGAPGRRAAPGAAGRPAGPRPRDRR